MIEPTLKLEIVKIGKFTLKKKTDLEATLKLIQERLQRLFMFKE